MWKLFKNYVPTSQRTQFISIAKTSQLVLYNTIMTAHCEIYTVWATRTDHKQRHGAYLALGFTRIAMGKSTKKEKRDKGKAIREINNEWINSVTEKH